MSDMSRSLELEAEIDESLFVNMSDEELQEIQDEANSLMDAQREDNEDYDDSMDGDHASGLASAGFGTDEDYEHNSYDENPF
jgi:hypothetical protein